jgi:hypothetical protein
MRIIPERRRVGRRLNQLLADLDALIERLERVTAELPKVER